uniref:Helitron helicase-like domain-containing protein n=1 Tax=Meloidogyne javanica TaxID=6303 RepID=A0A915MSZ5_MELJA
MDENKNVLPSNGQLYFLDTQEARKIRSEYIRENNKFAKSYELLKDVYEFQEKLCQNDGKKMPEIKLLFSLKDDFDQRRYNVPKINEVCAIMVSDANDDIPPARIVVYPKGEKKLKNIFPLDKCVEPMCYPLLYPNGTYGYSIDLKDSNNKRITLCDYTKFVLFCREKHFQPHFYAGKLFQQWLVDQAAKIEWSRLEYIKNHQTELCSSIYSNVEDFLKQKSLKSGAEIQKKVILPSTFSGGPRSMHEHFMDSMAIVNETGKPDLFITFTCNPNDPDILKCLLPGQTPSDRPDIN